MSSAFLLDRIIDEGVDQETIVASPPPWSEILRSVVKVRADNVADYVAAHWDCESYDYPCVAPPWPRCWIEWIDEDGDNVGMWCVAEDRDAASGWVVVVDVYHRRGRSRPEWWSTVKFVVDPLGRFVRSASAVDKARGDVYVSERPTRSRCAAEKGLDLTLPRMERHDVTTAVELRKGDPVDRRSVRATIPMLERAALTANKEALGLERCIKDVHREIGSRNFVYFKRKLIHVLAMTFSFCHCKNVVRDESFSGHERMPTKKRKDHPSFRFYTLRITPMGKAGAHEGGGSTGITRSLHIRRGHFRAYVPERPLFGRIVGTFWVPQHVVGDEDVGVVAKDYSVSPSPSRFQTSSAGVRCDGSSSES